MSKYLYNGVKMPAFPEEYATERPFAVLVKSNGIAMIGPYYGFVFSKSPITVYQKDGMPLWEVYDGSLAVYTHDEDESEYSTWDSVPAVNVPASLLIWSNHDILNEDGTVYLAASEPIPVSRFTPDPTSMTMGWLVGRRIAGQRSKVSPTNEVTL